MLGLMIAGFDADPSRVTEILDLAPTSTQRAGELNRSGIPLGKSIWHYTIEVPEIASGASHQVALKGLLNAIVPRIEQFQRLQRELAPADVVITGGYHFNINEQNGIWLEAAEMRILADAGIDWGVDLYPTDD